MGKMRLLALCMAASLGSVAGASTTELTGPHDNDYSGHGDGYDASAGSYDVPADSGGVPSATFNGNSNDGLSLTGATTSVTVEGGQFDDNFNSAVEVGGGATATFSDGAFNNDGLGVSADSSSLATVYGGQFLNESYCLLANGGTIAVYGGQYSAVQNSDIFNRKFADYGGTIDVYGAFAGVADG